MGYSKYFVYIKIIDRRDACPTGRKTKEKLRIDYLEKYLT